MALAPTALDQATAAPVAGAPAPNAADLRWYVFGLFFIFGGITSLNDVLIPKLKHLFTLTWFEAMLIQSAFFAAYFIVSLPAAGLVKRFGYMRTAVIGLLTMAAGCLLFVPASASAAYAAFLGALFVLAAGVTVVQVVANPLISMLGAARTVHSRLTFAQAFNSLGTTVFPLAGSALILGSLAGVDPETLTGAARDAFLAVESRVVANAYVGLAAALAVLAGLVWLGRGRLPEAPAARTGPLAFDLLRQPRFALGALCIFLYVGAEVAIGSVIVSFLMGGDTIGAAARTAGEMVALYWGGAMIGRFIGAAVLRVISPGLVLLGHAAAAVLLLALAGTGAGWAAAAALLLIGLCNSIMFPTIFSLASEELGARAADGSGIICMAIVGGAIVPPLMGLAADAAGLRASFVVPALCYAVIAGFGAWCWRRAGAARG